jgi:hypothetical protein
MPGDIERIIKNSSKAELLEQLAADLEEFDKAVVVLIQDESDGNYSSLVHTLGLNRTYEIYGILDSAKDDIMRGR